MLRRANARAKKQNRGRKGIKEHHHLDAMLLERSKAAGARRNRRRSVGPSSILRRMRARVCERERRRLRVWWVQGGRGACFYRGGARPWRAGPREHGGAEISVGFDRDSGSPARTGKEEDPDKRGPPGGETGREGMALGWIGPGAGKRAGARKMGRGKSFLGRLGERKGMGRGSK